MSKAFVTGGTGFVGSHLVEHLLRLGVDEVRCLVRTRRKWLEGLPIVEVRGDLFDADLISEAVRGVDYVYHNAGVTRAPDEATLHRGNVEATIRLMDVLARVHPGVRRVVVTSSLAVVGRCSSEVATEESPLRPVSRYGRSKADMERALMDYRDILPIVVVRPSSVYGPREADVFHYFRMMRRGLLPVVGPVRKPMLSLVHVADLVEGMVAAAQPEDAIGETFFLGSDRLHAWQDLEDATAAALGRGTLTVSIPSAVVGPVAAAAEALARLRGAYPPFNREKARELLHACKMCSVEKARRVFGYHPRIPLEEGVAQTIAWYHEHGWL